MVRWRRRRMLGGLVVITGGGQWVRQAGIWIHVYVGVGHAGKIGEERTHKVRAEGTVQADAQWLGMADRVPAGFDSLPRKCAAGEVGDGDRNDHR